MGLNGSSSGKPPAAARTEGSGHSGKRPDHEGAPDHVETPPPDAPAVEVPDISSTQVPKQDPRPPDRGGVPRVDTDAPTARSAGDGVSTELLGSLASLVWGVLAWHTDKCAFEAGKIVLGPLNRVIVLIVVLVCIPLLSFHALGSISEFVVGSIFDNHESLIKWKTIIILLSLLLVYIANKLIDSFIDGIKGMMKNIGESYSIAKRREKVWSRWFKIRKAQCKKSRSDVFRSMRMARQVKESEDIDEESNSKGKMTRMARGTVCRMARDNVREFGKNLLWIAIMLSLASILFLCVSSYHGLEDDDESDNQNTLKETIQVLRETNENQRELKEAVQMLKETMQVEPRVSAEPIAALPVLFHTAQVDKSGCDVSIESSGVKLEEHSKHQLNSFAGIVNSVLDANTELFLLVVGYASGTRISCGDTGDYYNELNVNIANLRAQAVGEFLNEVLSEVDPGRILCKEWEQLSVLLKCRPYRSLVKDVPARKDDNFVSLRRMNQSVMLYLIDGKDTNYICFGGKNSAKPCGER